jgi:hypothetical protein
MGRDVTRDPAVGPAPEAEQSAWDRWFQLQYTACREIEDAFERAMRGQPRAMRAALMAAVIEHFAERLRMDIDLPDTTPTVSPL